MKDSKVTCSEWVAIDDSGKEPPEAAHGEAADETAQLLSNLLLLKAPAGLWSYADV